MNNPLEKLGVKCECCQERPAIAVCSTSVPYSAAYAYCAECAAAGLDPYWILVTNTACCGGLEGTADLWQQHVKRCLDIYGKSVEMFEADVKQAVEDIEKGSEDENEQP